MVNCIDIPNSNTSQFFISLCDEPLTHLNGKNVVFGKLKSGAELLAVLNKMGDSITGLPKYEVIISDSGLCEKP
jgi:peptidyl-prolyl isomerase G (cyclophilin G)